MTESFPLLVKLQNVLNICVLRGTGVLGVESRINGFCMVSLSVHIQNGNVSKGVG